MTKKSGRVRKQGPRDVYSFEKLREYGVLWLINRVVFHPRGFALALEYEEGNDQPLGWSIIGDGSEPWSFGGFDEDELFSTVENLFAIASQHGRVPVSVSKNAPPVEPGTED